MTDLTKAAREALIAAAALAVSMERRGVYTNASDVADTILLNDDLRAALSDAPGEEREAFEAWALSENMAVDRFHADSSYIYAPTGDAWSAWQARAMLAARPEAPTVALTEEQADCGLPPLPSPATRTDFHHDGYGLPAYTADQMHVHAALAVAIERERCARICEQSDDEGEGPDSWGWHAKDYAKAIRKEGGA